MLTADETNERKKTMTKRALDTLLSSFKEGGMVWTKRGDDLVCRSKVHWLGGDVQEYVIQERQPADGSAQFKLSLPECARDLVRNEFVDSNDLDELLWVAGSAERMLVNETAKRTASAAKIKRMILARLTERAFDLIGKHAEASEQDQFAIIHKLRTLKHERDELLGRLDDNNEEKKP